ncbi:hypothetical protein [Marinovum sp.]|uniref:hypothetical protein n=1 Tax=Marinovum sp. TaxID=2024839 RepID=UPI002B2709F6|nr:hypothetical protein [Marinovum sp.]
MPAPKVTKASLGNAIRAIRAAGLTPAAVHIEPDGGIRIEISEVIEKELPEGDLVAANDDALDWEEVA